MKQQSKYNPLDYFSVIKVCEETERRSLHIGLDTSRSDNVEPIDVVMVRMRLSQWQDYHENRSISQPGPSAYSIAAQVADEIYQSRKPMLSISTPDPKLDLRVSCDTIISMINQRKERQEDFR